VVSNPSVCLSQQAASNFENHCLDSHLVQTIRPMVLGNDENNHALRRFQTYSTSVRFDKMDLTEFLARKALVDSEFQCWKNILCLHYDHLVLVSSMQFLELAELEKVEIWLSTKDAVVQFQKQIMDDLRKNAQLLKGLSQLDFRSVAVKRENTGDGTAQLVYNDAFFTSDDGIRLDELQFWKPCHQSTANAMEIRGPIVQESLPFLCSSVVPWNELLKVYTHPYFCL